MKRALVIAALCLIVLPLAPTLRTDAADDDDARPAWQFERIGRGLVAVQTDAGVFISWRLLATDPAAIAFNVYRQDGADAPVRLNEKPIVDSTNFVDRAIDDNGRNNERDGDATDDEDGGDNDDDRATDDRPAETTAATPRYFIRPILDNVEAAPTDPIAAWPQPYHEVPIDPIDGYRPGDASVGDLDGDGRYEIVLQQDYRPRDNSHAGVTGRPILDAYKLDGTRLWRIDLGDNIREGEHYTQFMVYDFDGDGRAELAFKTADGTTDGQGNVIGDAEKDWRELDRDSRSYGRVLRGPEFLTIFDGRTGKALKTVDYVPGRAPIDGWGGIGGNGGNDAYGNRCDRFLAAVAYLDGKRPSLVMCRGVYGRTVIVAWDWRGGELTKRWVFDTGVARPPFRDASPYSGMGGHSLGVADVDADGRDEIVYQAMVVDDNGKGLHTSGLRHGDMMTVGDLDPTRPGLEIFTVQENEGATVRLNTPGAAMRDARTGEILWSHSPGVDVPQGLAADIDPHHPGAEAWGGPGGLRNAKGERIGPAPRTTGFVIWWDGDPLRELLGGRGITKWNWRDGREESLLSLRTRGRYPTLTADLFGDWREELIVPSSDGRSLRVYTTTIPTTHRITTLMHDRQYRVDVAMQNVVYNRPPNVSFFLGAGMEEKQPR